MAETIKGLNIKLGLDSTELDHNLKGLSTQLKDQQKDLKSINNALKFDSSNVNLWKDKQDKLNQVLETTKKKLETQNARLEEAKKALKIGAISEEQFNQLKRSIQYTETDIVKLNNELDKTKTKIKSLSWINLESLSKLGSQMTKYVTAPILGAVSALTVLTNKSMDTADAIADNASKVYLSIEAYQKWSHAFKILAVDEQVMQKSFIRLNGLLGDIASGSADKYSGALSKIGLSTKDLMGLNSDQAFNVIRNSLSKLKDETLRVSVANEIFGDKLGSELAQVLSATTSEVNGLKKEAESLGLVTEEQAEIAGNYNDSLDKLKHSMSNLGVVIGTAFVPVLQKIVDTLQSKLIPAVKSLMQWWNNLSDGIKKMIGVFVILLAAIGPILLTVTKIIPLFTKLKSVMEIFKGGALFKGFSIGKLSIIDLIAVLAALLLKNEKFRELLEKLVITLGKLLAPIIDLISKLVDKLKPVLDVIFEVIDKVINSLVELIDSILEPLTKILDIVIGVVEILLDALVDLIEDIMPPLVSILKVIGDVITSLMPIVKVIIDLLANVLSKVLEVLMKLLEPIKKILSVIINVIGILMNVVSKLIDAILKPLSKVLEILASLFSVIAEVISIVVDVLVAILMPILEIVIAILEPILDLIMVIIEAIASFMEILMPLIDMILAPLIDALDFIKVLLEAFSPLLKMIGEVIGILLAPALELLFKLLQPVLWVLEKIIDAVKWVIENIAKAFSGVGKVFGKVGNFFGDLFTGKIFKSNSSNTSNSYTTNNVTFNTTSSTIDVNALNKALGGSYI